MFQSWNNQHLFGQVTEQHFLYKAKIQQFNSVIAQTHHTCHYRRILCETPPSGPQASASWASTLGGRFGSFLAVHSLCIWWKPVSSIKCEGEIRGRVWNDSLITPPPMGPVGEGPSDFTRMSTKNPWSSEIAGTWPTVWGPAPLTSQILPAVTMLLSHPRKVPLKHKDFSQIATKFPQSFAFWKTK